MAAIRSFGGRPLREAIESIARYLVDLRAAQIGSGVCARKNAFMLLPVRCAFTPHQQITTMKGGHLDDAN